MAIPIIDVAFAVSVTVPDRLPPLGLVIVIDGAGATWMLTPADVVFWPRVSIAVAVRVCTPGETEAVFQEVENVGPGPASAGPRFVPSS